MWIITVCAVFSILAAAFFIARRDDRRAKNEQIDRDVEMIKKAAWAIVGWSPQNSIRRSIMDSVVAAGAGDSGKTIDELAQKLVHIGIAGRYREYLQAQSHAKNCYQKINEACADCIEFDVDTVAGMACDCLLADQSFAEAEDKFQAVREAAMRCGFSVWTNGCYQILKLPNGPWDLKGS